jgi:foldase protein PrsA
MAAKRKTTSRTKVSKGIRVQGAKVQGQAIIDDVKKTSFLSRFKTRKFLIILFLILVGGILFYFKGLFIVATVNGQPVSRIALIQELEKRNGKQMLSSLVTQILIEQEAQKQNINVSQEEIDNEVKKVEEGLKKQGQSLDAALSVQGLTKDDFISQINLQKLVEKILAKDIKVTDKELSDYIEKNKDSIPTDLKPEEVTASARQQLEQQKLSTKAQPWIEGLQTKAKINYFINY